MVSDIPAGDEENDILFYSVCTVLFAAVFSSVWHLCCWGVDVSAVAGFTTFADDAIIPAAASVPAYGTILSMVFLLITLLLLLPMFFVWTVDCFCGVPAIASIPAVDGVPVVVEVFCSRCFHPGFPKYTH